MRESHSRLVIIDLSTGFFFFSIAECANVYGFINSTLNRQLRGITKNKTNLKII